MSSDTELEARDIRAGYISWCRGELSRDMAGEKFDRFINKVKADAASELAEILAYAFRFWPRVEVGRKQECWPWTGPTLKFGHGRADTPAGKAAHRLAYEITVGPIPLGVPLDHMCHDPKSCTGGRMCPHRSCVNPGHLRVSTNDENTSNERSRHSNSYKTHCSKGHEYSEENTLIWAERRYCKTCTDEKNRIARSKRPPLTSLTDDDVREIRSLARSGIRQPSIAEQFRVTQSAVSLIVSGRTWKHVK